jgi:hypothetical protein
MIVISCHFGVPAYKHVLLQLVLQLVLRHVQVVDPVAAAQPAARSKDLMRAMKEAAQGIGMRGGREVSSSRPRSRAAQQAGSVHASCRCRSWAGAVVTISYVLGCVQFGVGWFSVRLQKGDSFRMYLGQHIAKPLLSTSPSQW